MVFSTPVKAASGLALTSAGVAGTALAYKYSTDLYAIEKLAMNKDIGWKIKSTGSNNGFAVVTSELGDLAKNYGVESSGIWTCNLTIDSTKVNDLKTQLQTEFGLNSTEIDTNGVAITNLSVEKKVGFVNSCARNRAETGNTNNNVTSTVKLPTDKIVENLKKVFSGNWVNPKSITSSQ